MKLTFETSPGALARLLEQFGDDVDADHLAHVRRQREGERARAGAGVERPLVAGGLRRSDHLLARARRARSSCSSRDPLSRLAEPLLRCVVHSRAPPPWSRSYPPPAPRRSPRAAGRSPGPAAGRARRRAAAARPDPLRAPARSRGASSSAPTKASASSAHGSVAAAEAVDRARVEPAAARPAAARPRSGAARSRPGSGAARRRRRRPAGSRASRQRSSRSSIAAAERREQAEPVEPPEAAGREPPQLGQDPLAGRPVDQLRVRADERFGLVVELQARARPPAAPRAAGAAGRRGRRSSPTRAQPPRARGRRGRRTGRPARRPRPAGDRVEREVARRQVVLDRAGQRREVDRPAVLERDAPRAVLLRERERRAAAALREARAPPARGSRTATSRSTTLAPEQLVAHRAADDPGLLAGQQLAERAQASTTVRRARRGSELIPRDELVVDRPGHARVRLGEDAVPEDRHRRADRLLALELDREGVHRDDADDAPQLAADAHLRAGQVATEAVRVADRHDPDPGRPLGDEARGRSRCSRPASSRLTCAR